MTKNITRGTQIAYVPAHAADDLNHPDVEFGFVTSVRGDVAYCRYFSKRQPDIMRTQANSEATPLARLRVAVRRPQKLIAALLAVIEAELKGGER